MCKNKLNKLNLQCLLGKIAIQIQINHFLIKKFVKYNSKYFSFTRIKQKPKIKGICIIKHFAHHGHWVLVKILFRKSHCSFLSSPSRSVHESLCMAMVYVLIE